MPSLVINLRSQLVSALAILAATTLSSAAAPPLIGDIRVESSYVAAGERVGAKVTLGECDSLPPGAKLRVTVVRDVEIASAGTPGKSSILSLERPLAEFAQSREVAFQLDAAGMLVGSMQAKVEILTADDQPPIALAWSNSVSVGIRKRISLAGEWQVTKIEPYAYPSNHRPKDWKVPQLTTATLPGAITADPWLRGWFELHRQVTWKRSGPDLRPRFLRMSGINDSITATVAGQTLRETRPIEDMAVLTHWVEFHSPYKGEQHEKTRMLFLDLLPQPPVCLPLEKPLPAEGSADISLRIRGTSGQWQPKPLYGIHGDLHLELTPPIYVKSIAFDTEKPSELRRFKFQLIICNDTGREFTGKLRSVYGRYDGKIAYTGSCPAYASVDQPLRLAPGENVVEVIREERPRFDTCRATFMVVGESDRILDAESFNFHTVTFEIRNRRDFFLNNERFIVKGQGSSGERPHQRLQLRLMGGNAFRGPTSPTLINLYQSEGLLTSCGGALLASCEKCTFWNPKDPSNIAKAVRRFTTHLNHCPGIILWEATNELHGEPEEARVAILEAFHKTDPYHRPVLATKSAGEWEAVASDGRIKGVDVVGVQYLLSKEAVDSITAAVTDQPLMSTEVNWNDTSFPRDKLWQYWLSKGIAGSLLFDYSGGVLDQPAPAVPPQDGEQSGNLIKRWNRELYQDLIATAEKQADGRVAVRFGNQMPYTLRGLVVRARDIGQFALPDLAPGDSASIILPKEFSPPPREAVVLRVEYTTHSGLPHIALITPIVYAAPAPKGGAK